MSSFLDKLKGTIENDQAESVKKDPRREKKPVGFIQLDVDVYQTIDEFIICALVPGVKIEDLDIAIEEDNDIVTIQGKRLKPSEAGGDPKNKKNEDEILPVRQELQWGPFFRQIILPQEVNVNGVEAKLNKGVLVIKMPLLKIEGKGKKKININI
jgi:HSP20 family protein